MKSVFIAVLSALFFTVAQNAKADKIAEDVVIAKQVYDAAVKKAKDDLLEQFAKKVEEVRAGTLDADKKVALIQQFRAEKEEWQSENKLPSSYGMKIPVTEYNRALELARGKLDVAYKKAVGDYTAAGADEKAAALLEERNAIIIGEGYKLVGVWVKDDPEKQWRDTWTIKKEKGEWSITATIKVGNQEIASGFGKDFQFSNGVLMLNMVWVKRPRDWANSYNTFKIEKDYLYVTYKSEGREGKGTSGDFRLAPRQKK